MDLIEQTTNSLSSASDPESSPISKAMTVLCAYFREFLETDFKKARLPKRRYSMRDSKSNRMGVRIERFSQFRHLIAQKLTQRTASLAINPGKYRADLSLTVRAGIDSAIDSVDATQLRSSALLIPNALIQRYKIEKNLDKATSDARQALATGLRREIVEPLILLLEPVFSDKDDIDDSSSARQLEGYTDEVVELLLDEAVEVLPGAVADCLVKNETGTFVSLVEDLCDVNRIKLVLQNYFSHFGAADLFIDLRELLSSRQLLENTSIYLNVGEIQHKTNKFPLYYIPLDVDLDGSSIRMGFQSFIYVNKPACDYIAGELTRQTDRTVPNPISERIFHQEDQQTFIDLIEVTLHKILVGLQCNGEVDFLASVLQSAIGDGFRISNEMSLSLADQTDEAIVNDYEMLMSGLESDNPLVIEFESLVSSFLSSNPVSIERQIDTEWRELGVPDRLVFESPLPLAEEQRKLMQAVHNEKSRVIVVEGPPGTGKSHSLAALAFDVIQHGKNVLILSDKTEALNVVEGKLNDVIERIRGDEAEYVNPVLRLGRDSVNYANIVKTASIHKLKTSLQSFKSSESIFNQEFDGLRSTLTKDVRDRIDAGKNLDLREVTSFYQREDAYRELVPESDYFSDEDIRSLNILSRFFNLLDENRAFFGQFFRGDNDLENLKSLQRLRPALGDVSKDLKKLIKTWPKINLDRAEQLKTLQREIEDEKMPVFGYLFRKKFLKQASRTASDILGSDVDDVRKMRETFLELASIRNDIENVLNGRAVGPSLYREFHSCICAGITLNRKDVVLIEEYLALDHQSLRNYEVPVDIRELLGATEQDQRKLKEFFELREEERTLSEKFDAIPEYDYLKIKSDYEDLCAKRIANIIDERVVNFVEEKKNDAKLIKDIIRNKSKFPVDKFGALRNAFPVMIAGLRDYANYIPLEKGLFDLVIIDEASQVSIAQALPAILRSKKIVLMGDRKQFGNVKAATASKALNNAYFQEVKEAFEGLETVLDTGLQTRLKNLDVTKSVMDFGEMTSNFSIMLRKHFRGYPEIISFSSKHFYGNALQVLKLRGKPIEDVLEFVISDQPECFEEIRNANKWEADVIIERLEALINLDDPPSVAVITPFREQQRYINDQVMRHPKAVEFREKLHIAIFTADTCQGEERDIIFYSFVATRGQDRLNYVFPKDMDGVTEDETDGLLKFQRLNVAFSRGKEKLVFVCSKPIEEYKGSARHVLQHYKRVLDGAKQLPSKDQTDSKSPMEAQLLEWLASTSFATKHQGNLEMIPQFPVGEYLRSIDPSYRHPDYKVDFLLRLRTDDSIQQVIVEYDGFEFHFEKNRAINSGNWQHYLLESDVEREAILEGYGYKMLRVNRFNIGNDPISSLDKRLNDAFGVLDAAEYENEVLYGIKTRTEKNQKGLEEGTHKTCNKCNEIKPLGQFKDSSLKSGYGRICKSCKGKVRITRSWYS
ncbi:AAA domain-containing protein [Haliea sp. E17]|uniref:AAA domain-containing protein n=1 Tax=Haliea sp. E17 TaxID=3401576 RepID=UPI003AAAE089